MNCHKQRGTRGISEGAAPSEQYLDARPGKRRIVRGRSTKQTASCSSATGKAPLSS
jgi:hypothetical protein